jgi:nitroreductase
MMAAATSLWNVSSDDFPAEASTEEQLRFLLRYAVLAPSGHNTQPWKFRIAGETVELYADRSRALPVVDPDDRELTISCGAALFNLQLAMERFGHVPRIELTPDLQRDPDLLARIALNGTHEPTPAEMALFDAIPRRHTNRYPFDERALPESLLDKMTAIATQEGAWIHIVSSEAREALADLIAEGDKMQGSDPAFRHELADWIRRDRGNHEDGIPEHSLGVTGVAAYLGPLLIREFNWGKSQAKKDHQRAVEAPSLVVLGTPGDATEDWLHAGQALAHILLKARTEDVWSSYLNQPVEVPSLRPKLRELIGQAGWPQLVIRFGYGADPGPSPRRPVESVLIQ